MTAIALAQMPEEGSVFRARSPQVGCGMAHSDGYMCTAVTGHQRGDVPHVAVSYREGVVAIWDDAGHSIVLDGTGANAGATL